MRAVNGAAASALVRAWVAAGALALGMFLTLTQTIALVGGSNQSRPSASTASLQLSDDDAASVLFNLSEMSPGRAATNCITVSYRGSAPAATVRMHGVSTGTGLDAALDMIVEEGSGGRFNDCTGFRGRELYRGSLAAFTAAHRDFHSGLVAFAPRNASETKTFRFSAVLGNDPAAQGRNARAEFVWEAREALNGPAASGADVPKPGGSTAPTARRESTPRAGSSVQATVVPSAAGTAVERPGRGVFDWLRALALEALRKIAFPLLLLLLVIVFLMIQDRIDRSDPKLALAPIHSDPDVGFDEGPSTPAGRT